MNKPSAIGLLAWVSLSLTGCAGLRVSQQKFDSSGAATYETLGGIPVRVKVPVWVQETKLLQTGFEVTFTVKENGAAAVSTSMGSVMVQCGTQHEVANLVEQGRHRIPQGATLDKVNQELFRVAQDLAKMGERSLDQCQRTVSNVLRQEPRISDTSYYITHVIPLFGSGSGTFKLAEDGTLTESATSATDETGKTLLGLFPIKEKLSLRWGVTAPPADKSKAAPVRPLSVEVTIQPKPVIYTLRKDMPGGDRLAAGRPPVPPPLKYADVAAGGAELVSVQSDDEPPAPKPDTKSYQLKGVITPPEPAG